MNTDFERQQAAIYAKIAGELLQVIPEGWFAIELTCEKDAKQNTDTYCITNPDGERDIVATPESIFALYGELEELFLKEAKLWVKTTFLVEWLEDIEQWKYKTKYYYE